MYDSVGICLFRAKIDFNCNVQCKACYQKQMTSRIRRDSGELRNVCRDYAANVFATKKLQY